MGKSPRESGSVGGCFFHQAACGVAFAELGLFNLACGVTRDVGEDELAGALITGEGEAELVDLLLGAGHAVLDLDDGGGDLTQTVVGEADNGYVADLLVGAEEVLDLDGVEVFTAGDDDVLLTVYQVDEAVLVLAGHIARQEPAVVGENLGGGGGVLVVALHDAVTLDSQLAHLALWDGGAVFVQNAGLPSVACDTDGADLVDILHAQVDATGADGLGEAVVGIIRLAGELFLPTLDQGGGDGLGADVHEPPLGEAVFVHIQVSAVNGVQDILRPGNQKPDDGGSFLGDGLEDPLGADAAEEDGLTAGHQGTEPVHFGAGVVEGGDTEEDVVAGLTVVGLLGLGGGHEGAVIVEDGLREACGARGEVDCGVVVVVDLHGGGDGGAVVDHLIVAGGVGGAVSLLAHEEEIGDTRQLGEDGVHPLGELRTEDQHTGVGQIQAVLDLVGGVAVVHGNHDGAGLEDAEVDGEPLQAVHEEDGYLIALFDAAGEEEVGEAVGADVEIPPGHLAAVALTLGGFDEIILTPGGVLFGLIGGVDLHQGDLLGVETGVFFQVFGDGHREPSFCV